VGRGREGRRAELELTFRFVRLILYFEVQADSDFECLAVLMEHTQDVKSLAWHPHEEVRPSPSLAPRSPHLLVRASSPPSSFRFALRSSPQPPTTTPFSSSPTILNPTGRLSKPSSLTPRRSGRSCSVRVGGGWLRREMEGRFGFGNGRESFLRTRIC